MNFYDRAKELVSKFKIKIISLPKSPKIGDNRAIFVQGEATKAEHSKAM